MTGIPLPSTTRKKYSFAFVVDESRNSVVVLDKSGVFGRMDGVEGAAVTGVSGVVGVEVEVEVEGVVLVDDA